MAGEHYITARLLISVYIGKGLIAGDRLTRDQLFGAILNAGYYNAAIDRGLQISVCEGWLFRGNGHAYHLTPRGEAIARTL